MQRIVPMKTKGGNPARNQNKVFDTDGVHFYSYGSKIATLYLGMDFYKETPKLYNPYWNMYSATTNYYLLQFLEEDSIKEIRKKVISGDYLVV